MAQAPDPTGNKDVADSIRSVLDEYLSGLEPQDVKDCVKRISDAYNIMNDKKVDIDFTNERNRIAYMYLYFQQHCYVVYRVLCDLQQHIKARLTEAEELKVCCIGGGPGTELVALIIFLQKEFGPLRKVHCTIIDKDREWKETWGKIWENFPNKPNVQPEVSYESCDLLKTSDLPEGEGEGVLTAVREAHIVTMVTAYSHLHFMSDALYKMPRLKKILEEMVKESVMLFIDKDNDFKFENHFWKHQAEPAGMTRVLQKALKYEDGIKIPFELYEKYSHIYRFYNCMQLLLMSQCDVIANIFKK